MFFLVIQMHLVIYADLVQFFLDFNDLLKIHSTAKQACVRQLRVGLLTVQ